MKIVAASSLLCTACAGIALAQSPGTFTAGGSMITPRYGHTATLLLNGKVLIAGGRDANASTLVSAEIYDPETGSFSSTGEMTVPLNGTANLLPDGRVLIVGLEYYSRAIALRLTAEIYDPVSGTFSPAGSILRNQITCALATSLKNGKVLVGVGTWWPPAGVQGVPPYLYDPSSDAFDMTGKYVTIANLDEGVCPVQVLLADGRVLVTWESAYAEVYNPDTGTSVPTGDLSPTGSEGYTATLLTNGNVLVAGGDTKPVNSLYDPVTGKFTITGDMKTMRDEHTATLLPDGTVLIAGGVSDPANHPALPTHAELYQPDTGTFTETGDIIAARFEATATLLVDGTVLIAGGIGSDFSTTPVAAAEIYHPNVNKPAPVLLTDAAGQVAILHASTHQIVSPNMPATPGEALEVYMTGLSDGSVIPPQVFIGGRMADVLFFGNAPGFPGLNQINVRVPEGITPGPAVPIRLMYLGRPSNQVGIGVQ
jgi:hypothetical protein